MAEQANYVAEVLVFSEQKNPTWYVTSGIAQQLEELWNSLEQGAVPPDRSERLGYRGCWLRQSDGHQWFAFQGRVECTYNGEKVIKDDPNHAFERQLIGSAPPRSRKGTRNSSQTQLEAKLPLSALPSNLLPSFVMKNPNLEECASIFNVLLNLVYRDKLDNDDEVISIGHWITAPGIMPVSANPADGWYPKDMREFVPDTKLTIGEIKKMLNPEYEYDGPKMES